MVASCLPLRSRGRRSSVGSSPASAAASLVTRISPAAAADASRAVVFTASPSTVSSVRDPSPTAPTQAGPVWTPAPSGAHGPDGSSWPSGSQQRHCRLNRPRRVAFAGEEREEHRDDFIAHELVDTAVVVEDNVRGRRIEAIEQPMEVCGRHALGQRRRATDVGEQEAAFDLRAAVVRGHEPEARVAHGGVLVRLPLADHPHERSGCAREGGRAHLAAWTVREAFEDAADAPLLRIAAREEIPPELLAAAVGRGALSHGPTAGLSTSPQAYPWGQATMAGQCGGCHRVENVP